MRKAKQINLQQVLDNANTRLAERVFGVDSFPYKAPETWPKIQSRQVLSVLEAIIEEINEVLGEEDEPTS